MNKSDKQFMVSFFTSMVLFGEMVSYPQRVLKKFPLEQDILKEPKRRSEEEKLRKRMMRRKKRYRRNKRGF